MVTFVSRAAGPEVEEIRSYASPLRDETDLQPVIDRIGDARYVLLGEASHGTAEYYQWRAAITRRLVAEHGFSFVAVEGDWPDCYRVNRWVKGRADRSASAEEVLGRFERWPTWMWANREVTAFLTWLRDHNARTGAEVGFYGLDVYSLWDSLRAVLGYLGESHPEALGAARRALRCFDPYGEDPQEYAWATRLVPESCEREVVDLLVELRSSVERLDGDPEASFDAEQNAEVLAGAERYYRAMVRADDRSWNVRDVHMADTLDRLVAHHAPHPHHAHQGQGPRGPRAPGHSGRPAKAIVWAHNTHVGDARATDMAAAGMVNIGQLARQRHAGDGVVLVGFGGHHGTVVAADRWGARQRRMPVPPPPPGTHEHLLHEALGGPAVLAFPAAEGAEEGDDAGEAGDGGVVDRRRGGARWLASRRGHRAIGVVYDPTADHRANWIPSVIGARYDAFVSLDATTALTPLQPEEPALAGEQETWPWSE